MSLRNKGLIVAVVVIVGAVLAWQMLRKPAPVAATPQAVAPAQRPAAPPSTALDRPPLPQTSVPRPAVKPRPFNLTDIKSKADSGDGRAACLYGVQMLRCSDMSAAQAVLRSAEDELVSGAPPEYRDHLHKLQGRARAWIAECSSAPADAWKIGNRYLRQAALAGEPEAMFRYARGDSLLSNYSRMQSPEFDQWRKEAGDMMELAFEAGYVPALFDLMVAYSDDSTPVSGLIQDDPIKARATRLLLAKLSGREPERASQREANIEPAAAALAAQWQRDYFSAIRPPLRQFPAAPAPGFASLYSDDDDAKARNACEP